MGLFLRLFSMLLLLLSVPVAAQDSSCVLKAHTTYRSGNFQLAYKQYAECIRQFDSEDSLTYYECLSWMGVCAIETMEYRKALVFLKTADAFFVQHSFTREHSICLQRMASLAKRKGDYQEAETLLLKALAVQSQQKESSCSLKAVILNDLGVLYKRLGQYDRAIQYLSESLGLKKECLTSDDPSVYIGLNNLAGVYMKLKRYSIADSLYRTVIVSKTNIHGPDHPGTLLARNNLAELYRQQGDYVKALSILKDIQTRKKRTIGVHHPSYATTLHTIAKTYYSSGNLKEAERYAQQAIALKKEILGATHASTMNSCVLMAKIKHAAGKEQEALSLYTAILEIKRAEINTYFRYLGEEEKIRYVKANSVYWQDFTSFLLDLEKDSMKAVKNPEEVYNRWIENRWYLSGLILEETQAQHRQWEIAGDTLQRSMLSALQELKESISEYYVGKNDEEIPGDTLARMEERAMQLEKQLTAASVIQERIFYTVPQVTALLNKEECIIELLKPSKTGQGNYLALIYLAGSTSPHRIWLQATDVLEKKAYPYYLNAVTFQARDDKSFDFFWKPVNDFLTAHPHLTHLYIIREDIYECINLNTLCSKGGYLQDSYSISYLNKTESIVAYKQEADSLMNRNALFMYRPLFCKAGSTACDYRDLPGTQTEAENCGAILAAMHIPSESWSGADATEARLKQRAAGHGIIHIATHGFYGSGNAEEEYAESMVHSGLVLSGIDDTTFYDVDTEDGLLTAYEIAQLNLQSTELVVLSACQSGIGKIDAQEGMLGLQRGFFVAGSRRVLISLWKINDEVTAQWMRFFYTALVQHHSYRLAYEEAQKQIRVLYPAPYYWGAFVLLEQ